MKTIIFCCFIYIFIPELSSQVEADLIYINGTVLTMEKENPEAEAIVISGSTILYVGSQEEALKFSGNQTIIKDILGKTIMPAFVDPHNHFFTDAGMHLDPGVTMIERQNLLFAQGITTIGDPNTEENTLSNVQNFHDSGDLKIKTNLYLIRIHACNWEVGDWYKMHPLTENKSARLRIAGVKIFADGGSCGTAAAISWNYPSGGNGDLFLTQTEMNSWVNTAHNLGYQIVIHAQGDRAIDQAQNAYATILSDTTNELHHRIDHNAFVRPDQLSRYTELGIVPACFAHFPTCLAINSTRLEDIYGEESFHIFENWRALIDANPSIPISWHSDGPQLEYNTIKNMYSYVTRREIDNEGNLCIPPQWLQDHAITVEEVLPMMTINAAYALNREHQVGSLKKGKSADLIVLSDNPLNIDKNELHKLKVLLTLADGQVVFCSNGNESLCSSISTSINTNQEIGEIIGNPYPNPATDQITIPIYSNESQEIKINIHNLTGQVIYSIEKVINIGSSDITVYKSQLMNHRSGIIICSITSKKQQINKLVLLQ